MKQNDVSRMRAACHPIHNGLGAFVHPVLRIGIPLHDGVPKLIRNSENALVKVSIGETKELRLLFGDIG
ncbi:hypothetical protein D3C75_1316910 [compost metagenome]